MKQRRGNAMKLVWIRNDEWVLRRNCLFIGLGLDVAEATFVRRPVPDEPEREEAKGIRAHLRFDLSVHTRVLEQFPG